MRPRDSDHFKTSLSKRGWIISGPSVAASNIKLSRSASMANFSKHVFLRPITLACVKCTVDHPPLLLALICSASRRQIGPTAAMAYNGRRN